MFWTFVIGNVVCAFMLIRHRQTAFMNKDGGQILRFSAMYRVAHTQRSLSLVSSVFVTACMCSRERLRRCHSSLCCIFRRSSRFSLPLRKWQCGESVPYHCHKPRNGRVSRFFVLAGKLMGELKKGAQKALKWFFCYKICLFRKNVVSLHRPKDIPAR